MSAYKIFISSPGDVGRERHLAEQVIRRVAAEFQNRVEVQPYFWEYEPMESTRDYQENIPLTSDFDLVICILWKRLGSPLSVKHQRSEGGQWRSGTEFELVTAVESKKARGAPDIFIFKNDTKPTFEADEAGEGAKTELDLAQWKALIAFIKEWCEGVQDGQRVFTAALNRYQALDQFEQVLEKLLLGKLNERFPPAPDPAGSERTGLRPAAPTWTEGSPFRGLEAFQFLHAAVFCGRTHAIGEVLDRLRRKAAHGRPFVLILGASGSGKSSLAMAGVLPLLVKPGTIEGIGLWRRVVFRPGGQTEVGDLFDRLAAALVRRQQEGEGLPELISGRTTVERLAADLRADPKAAALLVRSALDQVAVLYREAEAQKLRGWMAESQTENRMADVERYGRLLAELTPREARLALVIDQAEELFTADDLNRRPELRTGFAVALDALAASGFVFVLATLRSDFYSQIQQLPAFVDLKEADGQFDLLPAQPAEIAQMIRQPALAAGLRFEQDRQTQEGLDEVLAYQVEAEPRLLPLLEFALDELYKQRSADGLLTFEAYRVHLDGSIVRALAKRADATFESLPERSRDAFRSVMRRLATTVDDRAAGSAKGPLDVIQKGSIGPAFQRQRVPYDQLTAHPPGAKGLVDAFVAARLLVVETGKTDDQKAEVTVAHEALFQHWDALKNLLLAERDDLILPRARVAASYEHWRAENRSGDFLLPPGKQLSEAEQLLAEYGEELTPELKVYVAASMAQAHAQQRQRQRVLVGALVVFALLAIFGFWQKGNADRQRIEAEKQRGQAEEEAKRAFKAEQTANEQRAEAEKQLERAQIEEGRAWIERAKLNSTRNSDFAAALMAARAVGFAGYGREKTADAKFNEEYPVLLRAGNGATEEKEARRQIFEASSAINFWLPLWQSPVSRQHTGPVLSVAWSPDGKMLASGSKDKTVKLWEASTGKLLSTLEGHTGSVTSVAWSPDGKTLASGSEDGTVKLWEASTGKLLSTLEGHTSEVSSVAWSPDGKMLASGSFDGTVKLWETSTRKLLSALEWPGHASRVLSVAWSPDGKMLASGSADDETVKLWEASTGKLLSTLEGHNLGVESVAWSPDGKILSSGSNDKTVKLWEASTGKLLSTLEGHTGSVTSVAWSPDGKTLASDSGNMWEASTGKLLSTLEGHTDHVTIVAWSPDGKTLATGSEDGTVKLWEASTGKLLSTLEGHTGSVQIVAWSPDGERLASGSEDKTVKLWEASTGKLLSTLAGHTSGVTSVAWSPDGERLASGSEDQTVKLWEASTGKLLSTLEGHTSGVTSVAWSPDGKTLASGSGDVRLWEAATGKLLSTLAGHANGVTSVAWSPDGKMLASGSMDQTVKLWEASTGKLLSTLADHTSSEGYTSTDSVESIAWSPDGKTLASGWEDQTVKLWEPSTGKLLSTLKGHTDHVTSVAWSPDGKRLASGSEDKTVLWEPSTGKLLSTLEGHTDHVKSVAWSPDGKMLASGSEDQIVKVWEPSTGKLLSTLEGHTSGVGIVAWSPGGKTLASGSGDRTVKLWEASTGKLLSTLEGHANQVGRFPWYEMVAWSPDGKTLASSSYETVKLWEPSTGKLLSTLEGHTRSVEIVAWSPDGKTLASSSLDGTVKLWEASTGKLLSTLEGSPGSVGIVAWSPDGKTLTSSSLDGTVKLSEASTGKLLSTLEGTRSVGIVAWSPDGKTLATGSEDGTVKLWEASTGKLLSTLEGHMSTLWGYTNRVTSVAWSPDGKTLATGSEDKTVKLSEASTGKLLSTLEGHTGSVTSVAWSPDGKTLATGSEHDGNVKLWEASTGKLLSTLEGHTLGVKSVAWSPDGKTLTTGFQDGNVKLWEASTIPEIDFAEYAHSRWVRLVGSEMVWEISNDNLLHDRSFDVVNLRGTTLLGIERGGSTGSKRLSDKVSLLLRAGNFAEAIAIWKAASPEAADLPVRRMLVAALSASGADDLFSNTAWRGIWLTEQIQAMITPEVMLDPAVSLGMLRLGTQLALSGSDEAKAVSKSFNARMAGMVARSWFVALDRNLLAAATEEITQLTGGEKGHKLFERGLAAYRTALEFRTEADRSPDWAAAQSDLGNALWDLGSQLEGEEGLNTRQESVDLLQEVISYHPDDVSRYRLASTLGSFAFKLVSSRQFGEAQTRCEEAQRLADEIGDGVQKSDRDDLIFIQANLAHALLFQGHYDDALAIYRKNWDKPLPLHGKTFGEGTLEDFAAFDKAGLNHPDLSRMKQALGELGSKAPSP